MVGFFFNQKNKMNIIKEYEIIALNEVQKNLQKINSFCIDVLKISPQADLRRLCVEIVKYISYICFNINPNLVDVNTDTVVTEFFIQTKNLSNFDKYQKKTIFKFINENKDIVRALFTVYIAIKLNRLKDVNFSFGLDGTTKKVSFFSRLWKGIKERGREQLQGGGEGGSGGLVSPETEKEVRQGVKNFVEWVGKETGIGQGQGNAADSGGKIYYGYKFFFPSGELSRGGVLVKENISANYLKEWKKIIEAESGLPFDVTQKGLEVYKNKVLGGFFKTQAEFYAQLKKDSDDYAALLSVKKDKKPSILGILKRK